MSTEDAPQSRSMSLQVGLRAEWWCPSTLENRVNSGSKNKSIVSVGRWRCFATMTSAQLWSRRLPSLGVDVETY
jgi:hypothetical protein